MIYEIPSEYKEMFGKLPNDAKEIILDFIDYKKNIKTYFKDNIATKIDKTLTKINNSCELCYIQKFKKTNDICLMHLLIGNKITEDKYYSLHNLPNGAIKNTFGRLFLAIDNINLFLDIIDNTDYSQVHKLSDLNNEFLQFLNAF